MKLMSDGWLGAGNRSLESLAWLESGVESALFRSSLRVGWLDVPVRSRLTCLTERFWYFNEEYKGKESSFKSTCESKESDREKSMPVLRRQFLSSTRMLGISESDEENTIALQTIKRNHRHVANPGRL